MEGNSPLSKIYRTYRTMMKLGTVIPYLKKIKKKKKSRDTTLESAYISIFFNGNQELFLF